MSQRIFIDRPPRIQPELPFDEIEIPSPPEKEERGYSQLIQIALPLLTIIGYVLVTTLGGSGRSPWMLIPMALSVVASTGFSIYTYLKEKRQREEIEKAYEDRLVELSKEMNNYHDQQRRFYRYNYPDRTTTFRIVKNARTEVEKTERTLRSEARLWERRVDDDDFGAVRLGMGTLPSTVLYVLGDVENFSDPQVRAAMKLQEESQYVADIPVIINLRQPRPQEEQEEEQEENKEASATPRTPTIHALGIAGSPQDRPAVYEFTRAFLSHFVVYHAPMNARLFVLATNKQEWLWTTALPHCQGDEQTQHHCFVEDIDQEAQADKAFDDDTEGAVEQFLEGIRKILAARKIQMHDRDDEKGGSDPTQPFLLLVVDLLDVADDAASPLRDLEADAAISILLEEGAALGAAVIFLVSERSKVPGGCLGVVEIERTIPETNSAFQRNQTLHFRYAEVGVNSYRYVGKADFIAQPDMVLWLAQQLAQMEVRQSSGANLANGVSFMPLMGYDSLQELQADTWRKWQDSAKAKYANWLRVKIGLMSGNKPRTLVFSAKRDGVHGMVAGSTGSGKSELLISLIVGMAVTYSPTVLNFVLVDYKGGGAFKEFKELPHCVDVITNLAGDGVTRMFTAITSEMRRRQALNAETGTKNIVDYRQQGLHISHKPYPYLFMIIDEFAEMIADRPEYRTELESITRVGRAQGVSLILAAQRPSGVTDQMRSNIKFRICLRVETPGESREMLRRSDAAFLPSGLPGRGYLQVGNEEIELVQVAYTGEKYVDPDSSPRANVIWPERQESYNPEEDQDPPELYKVIITSLDKMAREGVVEKQRAPWPEPLRSSLSLSQLLVSQDPKATAVTSLDYLTDVEKITMGREADAILTLNPAVNKWLNGENGWIEPLDWEEYAMRPVVGLIDNPYDAKQLPLVADLRRGHMVVFGASGLGKTTFIRSLVVSLAATHSPNDLWIYILDLGGRQLGVLENLPHVGAVIIPDAEGYEERVEQLLRELDDMVGERKNILGLDGTADIYQYNKKHPEATLPAVLVAIDNFIEFNETFDNQNDAVESVLDKFVALARQAKPYGVHFVITATRLSVLSNQLFSLFTERLTLKLAETADYRAILGGQVADIGDVPGRGYIKYGHLPLSVQVAFPVDLQREGVEEAVDERKELEQFAQSMTEFMEGEQRGYKQLLRVDALPKSVLLKQILSRQLDLEIDEQFLAGLRQKVARRWRDSLDAKQADWLRVTIGTVSGNRLRDMHLEAKHDGVHGMIAGGTGSGKSELLMTLIVGLALAYDPSVLNFVLVDYKGGGAFAPFGKLPHCVDIVTNLNKSAVRRMFTAIGAEIQRRQKLNADTDTKDIVEYRAKGFHRTHEPYPHLFIIIDEYAEMITTNPEFKDELDSITRVGRAQGVNLLLASQRPTGVTDQMRANIKYRICLRVEGVDTSREMLRRSDAAFLPSGMPGRGYLQVGNENIELIQIAWTGDEYEHVLEGVEEGKKPKFYDVAVLLANELLQGGRPRTPWPAPLPTKLTLSSPLVRAYMHGESVRLLGLDGGEERPLMLNPAIAEWLAGNSGWQGVNWRETAMRAVVGLIDDPYNAIQLPLIIDLTKGHFVIFGASGWGKNTFMRTLIVTLAATHSPDEFHAHVLDLGGRNLDLLKVFPHVGTVIRPDEGGYEERVQQLLRELNDIVDRRKRLFSEAGVSTLYEYNISHPERREPAILVAIDNFAEYIESFGGANKSDEEDNLLGALVLLVRQAKAYGLHFVISAMRPNELSSKLYSLFTERLTLRLSDSTQYRAIVGGQVTEIDEIPGRGYIRVARQPLEFQIAVATGVIEDGQLQQEVPQIRLLGQQMQTVGAGLWTSQPPLRIDKLEEKSSYRQVQTEILHINQDHRFLDELKAATREVWARNGSAEGADWLRVVLGITSGNRMRELQLEAKRDGVHGLIAGGTGSGKSELLMTLIVGLALNYSPDILNFVLVDYKGGGAFAPFRKLPHCVDIVTNLNKAAVNRMFVAINAEMRRRQRLNAETGTKDIVEYRRKGLHLTGDPYPHLFVIIDEYSEIIDNNPEYKAELESITRVGRAQGVNLLLASQRPKGVTDQMRANIKLRLCLRVEEMDTSREMLRRPDAALLPNGMPGRGYLQIGNENLELIQVSWTGENQPDEREAGVVWPEREVVAAPTSEDVPKFFDAVVSLTSELVGGQMARKPWPSFLPRQFSLQSPLFDAQRNGWFVLRTAVTDWLNGDTGHLWPGVDWREEAMRPVGGLLDNPAEAQQMPLTFHLSREHLAIFGDSGWGKSSFTRTLIVDLATTHSPAELHVYVLDLGGRTFRTLEELPHVGAVIYSDEETYEERLQRLLDKLNRMVDERQLLFSQAKASDLYEYNQRHPQAIEPAVLVVIDNIVELRENNETLLENTVIPLVRRSLKAGISFVVTGNTPSSMPSKLYGLFGERVTFKQSNSDRYMDIVGRGAIEIEDVAGRGYIRVDKRPLLFHAAQPVGLFNDEGRDSQLEGDELELMARHMQAQVAAHPAFGRNVPDSIRTLPEVVPLIEMLREVEGKRQQRPLGVLGQNVRLQSALFDLRKMGSHFVVTGPPLSGKTTTLYNWVLSLAYRHSPEQVMMVLVDLSHRFANYGGERSLMALPHVVTAVFEPEELDTLLPLLKNECAGFAESANKREIFVIIDNFDDFAEETERARDSRLRELPRELATLARKYGREGLHFLTATGLDGSSARSNALYQRVRGANYGIGLRSGQAINALGVTQTPAALRMGKELPVGRGFIVRSGQLTLLQVASPYEGMGVAPLEGEDDEEDDRVAQALDVWVEMLCQKYPGEKANWAQVVAAVGETVAVDPEMQLILDMVKRILHKQGDEAGGQIENWDDKVALFKFVEEALQKESSLPASVFGSTRQEILAAAAGYFPEVI
ncbi:MAG: FtsK/SpoIIIE domain-containing protein [Chloroflexota bacterium]